MTYDLALKSKTDYRRGGIESESSLYIHVGTKDGDRGRLQPRSLWNRTRTTPGPQIANNGMVDE
jgi:hypothetical protein